MILYGPDLHPQYQAGIDIEQIAAEGCGFLACKVSEGTNVYDSLDWLRRGQAAGMIALGYHYLRPGDETAQAATFAGQLARAGHVPGMLDAEALAADGSTPTLTVESIRRFLAECARLGARVPLIYLPRWYWQRMGSPDLTGFPMLWASSYVAGGGHPGDLYAAVTPRYWAAYGGLPVAVLQFTDCAQIAGREIDCSAYLGTREQFASLVSATSASKGDGMGLIPFVLPPGKDTLAIECPVGKASAITAAAWISAMSKGPVGGDVRFWFQDDGGGISETPLRANPPAAIPFANGHSGRVVASVPDGTTMIRIDYNLPAGGTILLETKPK